MIGRLVGTPVRRQPGRLLLDVGGVGYDVHVSLTTYADLPPGGPVTLEIHTHVRDTEITLFGFVASEEKALFERLQTVAGIGPRLALGILSGMPPGRLAAAIRDRDVKRLTAIPGVGRRTAERMVTDLAEKVEDLALPESLPAAGDERGGPAGLRRDVRSALVNLGYAERDVERVLDEILARQRDLEVPIESLLRDSLRILSRA